MANFKSFDLESENSVKYYALSSLDTLLFLSKITIQTAISVVYGDGALAENIIRKWFTSLRSENFDLID